MRLRICFERIYLAGSDVFPEDSVSVLQDRRSFCASLGFDALSPFDSEIPIDPIRNLELARKIFLGNIELIQRANFVLANCNPFRGALVDDGTAFEIGYAFSLGKKIYGYTKSIFPLPEIVKKNVGLFPHSTGYAIDKDGYLVNEDFGNSLNLMLEFSIEKSGGVLVEGEFEDCLKIFSQRETGV
ncbi:nucleoside 2-deoxyribosyltransferase [Leptospira santarosai]|uniref:nucleoside 2-deoxyribosyltransferase n=1 Tax=Leptospira santarosai TaxID=28183 RepID=UPI0002E0670F|nr:nucleoside 2-deoxyribosyltransferase [Leptospira santarosai]